MAPPSPCQRLLHAGLGLALGLAVLPALAQVAGAVEFSKGVGFAQSPGQTPRTLGRGLPLNQGDRLTTSDNGMAVIKLEDGTRMTVRPSSELVLQQYQYRADARDNSFLLQLVRGGFRAVTGLISKGSSNAARVQTNTATIGIRGTDFDARICQADCAAESGKVNAAARPNQPQASAKVVGATGEISALDAAGQRRRLVDGGPVFPGDTVETASGARGMLAFRDESRVTLGANTRFRVDNFVYDQANAGEGRFLATLLRGSVRALTGLIAKSNNRNVGFSTATATIGIRGTGFDMGCTGACAGEATGDPNAGLTLFTWLGAIEVTASGQTALQLLQAGQGLFISPAGIVPIANRPGLDAPEPAAIPVPPNLFGGATVPESAEGLYVFVRDGHIEIVTATEVLELGKGEVGYAGPDGHTARPASIPLFIDFDRIPLPGSRNPLLVSLLSDAGIPQNNQCR